MYGSRQTALHHRSPSTYQAAQGQAFDFEKVPPGQLPAVGSILYSASGRTRLGTPLPHSRGAQHVDAECSRRPVRKAPSQVLRYVAVSGGQWDLEFDVLSQANSDSDAWPSDWSANSSNQTWPRTSPNPLGNASRPGHCGLPRKWPRISRA